MLLNMLLASLSVASADVPPAVTRQALVSTCKIGSDPTPSGSTPTSVEGVTIVSPREAKCVIERFKSTVVIAPMRDVQQIPGATPIVALQISPDSRDGDARFVPAVTKLTGGDLARPVLVYCHHTSCAYSYDAALHLKRLGYRTILWLREGIKGWTAAGYPLVPMAQVTPPADEPAYGMYVSGARGWTFGCFGEEAANACNMMVMFYQRAFRDPALKPADREFIAGQLFNAGAVRAENLRKAGKAKEGYDAAREMYAMLVDYAGTPARRGVLSENAKVLREYALASLETGRPDEARQALAALRKDAAARYADLPKTAKGSDARGSVQGMMVAMEHAEQDIAEYAAKKATDLYKAGKTPQANAYRAIADASTDRAILWNGRNATEGIGHMMDLQPGYRIALIKRVQGDLAVAAGDRTAASEAYMMGAVGVCSLLSEQDMKAALANQPVSGEKLFAAQCFDLSRRYAANSPQAQAWAAKMARQRYDYYLSLLKD